MADYKDYIVRYDIQANTVNAATGLKEMISAAEALQAPLKTVQESITQVGSAARLLRESIKEPLVLTLDTKTFQSQVRTMVSQVEEAAVQMRSAIYNALKGNPQGTKAVQTGIGKALDGKRTIADIKRSIAETEKELDKLMGARSKKNSRGQTIRDTRSGSIYMARNNASQQAALKAQRDNLQAQLKADKAELREMESIQKQIAAVQSKATSQAQKTTAVAGSKPKPTSNVTVAQMKAWKQLFGNKNVKSLTLNVIDEATPVITAIKTALEGLKLLGKFEIMPTINKGAYSEVERQLTKLAALSQKVANPLAGVKEEKGKSGILGKEDKTKLAAAQKQLKSLNAAAAPIQQRLNKNLAIPEEQRTAGIKGQITKDTKALAALTTQAKEQERIISTIQGKKGTSAAPQYTIPVGIKLMTETIAPTLESLAATLPPLPIKVQLMTEGVNGQIQALTGVSKSGKGGKGSKVGKAATASPAPKPVYLTPKWAEGTLKKADQLQRVSAKLPPINLNLNIDPALAKLAEFTAAVKSASPQNITLTASGGAASGAAAGKGATAQTSTKVTALSPLQYRDKLGQALSRPTPISEQIINERFGIGGMGTRVAALDDARDGFSRLTPFEQKDNAARHKAAVTQSIASKQRKADALRAQAQNAFLPFAQNKSQLDILTKYRKFFKEAVRTTGIMPNAGMSASEQLRYLQGVSSLMQKAKVAVPWQLQSQINQHSENIAKQQSAAQEAARKTALSNSIAQKQQQANRLRAQLQNSMLPFAQSKEQLDLLTKYRRYFREAAATSGIMPTPGMTGAPMVRYLQEVSARMQASNVAVPWQLQSQIGKLQESISKQEAATQSQTHATHLANRQRQADRLRAQAHNAMLPFAQNKEQLNMLTKYRRYFRQAVSTTGIVPTTDMAAPQMLRYLNGVSAQMQRSGVAVPWTLQSQINKLGAQVAAEANPSASGGGGGGSRTVWAGARPKSAYDRFRKWSYPLTGQTSFGARTPMAVDMAKGMGVMFAIDGAMSAIGSSFSQAMEYQNTMRTTQAILQNGTNSYTQNGFKNMERTVRDVGVKTKFSAPEVANASRFLAMAGYDIDAINAAIRPIADLALIGDMDLGEVADKMTNIMTVFGATPEVLKANPSKMREMANIMTTTATRSNTDLMMLAESAKYGGGVANMYGKNDPNLFADTMAIFGVMGNAGVQGSSAGTAIRMMYQNLFKPNKNQKKTLEMLKSTYGISTLNGDGSYRAMSDILVEMAQRIPENKMAEIVGNLFRITAQPGATAAIMAAAGGDANVAQEIVAGNDEVVKRMSSKSGLSALASLMVANRNSVNGNISGAVSEEKQNTISGLWAQVTSMFTEAIVQAFEQREGGFAEMLKKIRDYFAKPETVTMIQNLIDMIIEIGKVMAWFVKIWAGLYNAVPGLVKWWVIIQMTFTQVGTLIAPLVQLMGVFNRLGGAIMRLSGVSMVASTNMTRAAGGRAVAAGAAGTAAWNAPFIVGQTSRGRNITIRGNIARRAHQAMANNAILAGELALSGADRAATLKSLNKGTVAHYAAVRARANKMYGWGRVARNFKSAATAGISVASFAPMVGGLKSIFMGLMGTLAKGIGLLCNPITLAVGAAAALGYGIYKLVQRMNGTTDAQKAAFKQNKAAADNTVQNINKSAEWYNRQNEDRIVRGTVIRTPESEAAKAYTERQKKFKNDYNILFRNFGQDASNQSNQYIANQWRNAFKNNPSYKLALGNKYDEYAGAGLTKWTNSNYIWNKAGVVGVDPITAIHDVLVEDEDHAVDLQKRMVQGALMAEGGNSAIAQEYVNRINTLKSQLLSKDITQTVYNSEIKKLVAEVNARIPKTAINGANLTAAQFQNISNPEAYTQYWAGFANIINASIRGDYGTQTGAMQAWFDLTNRDDKGNLTSGLQTWSQQWYSKMANVMNDIRITDHFIGSKAQKDIEIILSMCPTTGKIDTASIVEQVRAQVGNFNLTLQQFADMMNKVYDMLKELGVFTDDDDRYQFVRNQLKGTKFTSATVRKYYKDYIGSNPNSEWVKAGISENDYVNWAMGIKGAMSDADVSKKLGRTVTQQQEFNHMNNNLAHAVVDKTKSTVTVPTTPTVTPTKTPTTTPPPATDQDAYASHYDRSVARPTQIVFNINEMAHFDRTTVASSAEERDLIAAMEAKIAPAVYQIFAQAANQANNMQLA